MKLELTNDTKIAIWKIGNAALMCQDNDITSAKYEEISLEAMNEANEAQSKNSGLNIPVVSGSAFDIKEIELFHFAIIKALPHTSKKTNGYEAMVKTRDKLAGVIKEHYR